MLMGTFPKPNVIVCDGAKSIESAAKRRFGTEIAIQRCFVHINRYVKSRIGKKIDCMPRKRIVTLCKEMFSVETKEQAEKWNEKFYTSYKRYENKINAYHLTKNPNAKNPKKKMWNDRNLHFAWSHVKYAYDKNYLWTHLEYEKGIVPRDTNSLEGGINSHLKQLNFIHRGMRYDDEQRMIGWDLVRKSEFEINGFMKDLNIQKTKNLSPKTKLKSSQFDT